MNHALVGPRSVQKTMGAHGGPPERRERGEIIPLSHAAALLVELRERERRNKHSSPDEKETEMTSRRIHHQEMDEFMGMTG
jgi:hypothetical protein